MATRIPIPLGQQQRMSPLGLPAARAPMVAVEDQTGRAVSGLGQAAGQMADAVRRQEKEEAIAWVSKASSDDQIKWMQRMAELQEVAEPGAPDFTPNFLREFDDYAAQAVSNAPEPVRAAYRESLTRQRTQLGSAAVTFEAGSRRQYVVGQYETGKEADAQAIALNPALYDERRALRLAALNSSSLPESLKAKLIGEAKATLAYAAGAAMADRDPYGVAAAMEAAARGESVEGFRWVHDLDSDRIQQLRTRVQTQIDRQENRARIEADRALTRAQRAVNDIEQQISTGVPARPDDMLRWAGMVAGTEYEDVYRDLVRGQEEVQRVLRLPLNEQSAYIQAKRQEQQTGGANRTDIANLNRLERAVQSNIEMLRTAPLSWVENRTGAQVAPLNMVDLMREDGAAVIGQSLRDRVDSIRALQRMNPPGAVAMRPLLAAEAEQLSNAFTAAGAGDRRQMLGALYWAAGGDQEAYQGVIGQIKAANPFMARMGALAASFETAKLESGGWFSSDVLQSAGDAAATALHGDEILRAGGKEGTVRYPVPKDEEFIKAVEAYVGDLYRGVAAGDSGAEDFMQDAYAVKAYYVGRAAQQGSLSTDIDTDRLAQAVTAVLGQPVNFNGIGRVLAPWGMDSRDFTRRASNRLETELKARGMWDQGLDQYGISNAGLIGVGGGLYAATLGGIPMRDPSTGDIVTITMRPDADTGRDAFGQPLSNQIPGVQNAPTDVIERGNIDLSARPVVRNADGSISTVRSMSFEEDGKEVLIPTVSDDGAILSDADAIEQYRRTGRHLGKFNSPEAATRYAEQLHAEQERMYGGVAP